MGSKRTNPSILLGDELLASSCPCLKTDSGIFLLDLDVRAAGTERHLWLFCSCWLLTKALSYTWLFFFFLPSRCPLPKHSLQAGREIFYQSHTTGSAQQAWHCTPVSLQPFLPRDSVPRLCPQQRSQGTLSAWQSSERGDETHGPPTSCHCPLLPLWQLGVALGTHSPAFAGQSKKPASWDGNCSYHLSWTAFTQRQMDLFSRILTCSSWWMWGPS